MSLLTEEEREYIERNVQWSENESYVTISRTFNIPHSMFDKWLEDKKEDKNKEE